MRPLLNSAQGRLIRVIGLYLRRIGKCSLTGGVDSIIIEKIESTIWSSLTFAGERQVLVLRLPGMRHATAHVDFTVLDLPARIIAVRRAAWTVANADMLLSLDLLELEA